MFSQLNMTTAGAILASQTALGDTIEFTKIKMGNGAEPPDYRTLTDLVNVMQTMPIARQKIVDINTIALGSNLMPANITTNFYWREIGVFAKNLTKGTAEVLFSYGYTQNPSYISSGGTITEKAIDVDLQLSDSSNVVINLDYSNLFPTKYEVEEYITQLDEKVQNDIRSSKNIWLTTTLGDLAGDTVTKLIADFVNLNIYSSGEQATPNVGDWVITDDGHEGYISDYVAPSYTVTTVANAVERKKLYGTGDWEYYLDQGSGGGHYYWDSATGILTFELRNSQDNPAVIYDRASVAGGSSNFQITGGSRIGARILTAWDGGAPGSGQLRVYYTQNKADPSFVADDEISTHGWVKNYVAANTGIFVGGINSFAGTKPTDAEVLAGSSYPSGHALSANDWVVIENDPQNGNHRTSWIRGSAPNSWTFASIRSEDIPDPDNVTIYLDSNGQYAVKPNAPINLGSSTVDDDAIGNRTITNNSGQATFPTFATTATLTAHLQQIYNALNYLNNKTVKAPDQKIFMYVQDSAVTPEAGVNKVRIPITENQ